MEIEKKYNSATLNGERGHRPALTRPPGKRDKSDWPWVMGLTCGTNKRQRIARKQEIGSVRPFSPSLIHLCWLLIFVIIKMLRV